MRTRLGRTIILVDDYDKAFDFYERIFSCKKIFDQPGPNGRRYLHVSFSDDDDTGVWFLKAETPLQDKLKGNQTGGQPTLVIYTDDIVELFEHASSNGVIIEDPYDPGRESKFFHCLDLYGNRLTVVELPG